MQKKTKNCHFCQKEISFQAIKCKHCHKWLDDKKSKLKNIFKKLFF